MRTSSLEMIEHLLGLVENVGELRLVEQRLKRVVGIHNTSANHGHSLGSSRNTDTLPILIASEPECDTIYISANNTDKGHSERHWRMGVDCFK